MADKKVDRSRPDRAVNPTQQMTSSLSNSGTINMSEVAHDKGRSALLDKFRRREERWRAEQSLHDREVATASSPRQNDSEDASGNETKRSGSDQGGVQ